ncbi:class I SAM-dependent methyltransferase [Apilactobacillus sp. TMW 2.2459]|uniref:class I SAM-dependent methyltransferase n=1 Tax=Apilactobacillus xinyiensis TaxID=2841032 RepID=UPI00200CEC3F|nr:class I SAM-dependent methyltransferase [Apilactobacillus xinyiensis]MCL0312685.1 class I SAM-dependent methyltransferase [Apilactobacillus xinyiensis]
MNDFYYTPNPDAVHKIQQWDFELLGNQITFTTDNGVFSKKRVDYGSVVLMNAFNISKIPSGKILDLGCGYGPVGIALAKKYTDREFDLVDVNNRALSLAQTNAKNNGVDNRLTIYNSNIYENIQSKYAAIVVNPPIRAGKMVVNTMLSKAKNHLLPSGTLTAVLQKKQGAPSAKKLMKSTFGNCEIIKKNKGYYILESIYNGDK